MYQIMRLVSLLVRWYLCYLTIDNVPIMSNHLYNELLLEVFSLHTILWVVSYFTVGKIYKKGDGAIFGVILYFIVYITFLGMLFCMMLLLTFLGILPL